MKIFTPKTLNVNTNTDKLNRKMVLEPKQETLNKILAYAAMANLKERS